MFLKLKTHSKLKSKNTKSIKIQCHVFQKIADASGKKYIIAMQIENKIHLGLQNRCWSSVYKLPFAIE
jgi:hypothetical protein